MLPSEAIIRRKTMDVTTITSRAHIRRADSVTTGLTAAGRKNSVMRQTVTTTTSIEDVTCPTITVHTSNTRTKNVTSTHPGLMTAVHADCLMVFCT